MILASVQPPITWSEINTLSSIPGDVFEATLLEHMSEAMAPFQKHTLLPRAEYGP